MKKIIVFSFALFLIMSSIRIASASFTFEDNILDYMLINPSTPLQGSFGIDSVLDGDENYTKPYDIVTAQATFVFSDDGDDIHQTSYSAGQYTLHHSDPVYTYWWNGAQWIEVVDYTHYYYYRDTYDYFFDDQDYVGLSIANEYSNVQSNWYSMEEFDGLYYDFTIDHSSGTTQGDRKHYFSNNYDSISGYTGEFTLVHMFGSDALENLRITGEIDFTLSSLSGDMYLESGSLEIILNPNPVPIPGAVWLLGTGILGIAGIRRKLKK